jgi:hypothetical protein
VKFLTILSLNLCFVSEVQQDVEACTRAEELCLLCVQTACDKTLTPLRHWEEINHEGRDLMNGIRIPTNRTPELSCPLSAL